jgi:hypothetical protein
LCFSKNLQEKDVTDRQTAFEEKEEGRHKEELLFTWKGTLCIIQRFGEAMIINNNNIIMCVTIMGIKIYLLLCSMAAEMIAISMQEKATHS